MQIATATGFGNSEAECVEQAVLFLKEKLNSDPHLIFLFAAADDLHEMELVALIQKEFPGCSVVGSSGSVVIEGRNELSGPAVSVMGCVFPKTEVDVVHIESEGRPGEDDSPAKWRDYTGLKPKEHQQLIVFADPYTKEIDSVLKGLDYAYSCPVTGGFSSSSGESFYLFAGDRTVQGGVVIVSLSGKVDLVPIVAQGCRPIGDIKTVTSCDGVMLKKLDGDPAVESLRKLSGNVSDSDRELMQHSLFLGVETGIMKSSLTNRDFLMRNIRGINPETGAIIIGDLLHENQSVRFNVRDPESSRGELEDIIERLKIKLDRRKCHGVLLFSCLGRVKEFYKEEGVDAGALMNISQSVPLSGFFCNGEIGQISGETYIHGYTASALLFYEEGK